MHGRTQVRVELFYQAFSYKAPVQQPMGLALSLFEEL
jgi:hypothetical protein